MVGHGNTTMMFVVMTIDSLIGNGLLLFSQQSRINGNMRILGIEDKVK